MNVCHSRGLWLRASRIAETVQLLVGVIRTAASWVFVGSVAALVVAGGDGVLGGDGAPGLGWLIAIGTITFAGVYLFLGGVDIVPRTAGGLERRFERAFTRAVFLLGVGVVLGNVIILLVRGAIEDPSSLVSGAAVALGAYCGNLSARRRVKQREPAKGKEPSG